MGESTVVDVADTLDVGAVVARAKRAQREISDLCHGRRKWTMSVPVQLDRDSDIVLADSVTDALTAAAAVRTLRRRLIAAQKVIAREYHDANGNLARAYPPGLDEIGDILLGLCDAEIAAAINADRAAADPHAARTAQGPASGEDGHA